MKRDAYRDRQRQVERQTEKDIPKWVHEPYRRKHCGVVLVARACIPHRGEGKTQMNIQIRAAERSP